MFNAEQVSSLPTPNVINPGQHTARGSNETIIYLFRRFILEFQSSDGFFTYRDAMATSYEQKTYFLDINLEHLLIWSAEHKEEARDDNGDTYIIHLYDVLQQGPNETLSLFEQAAITSLSDIVHNYDRNIRFQITLSNYPTQVDIAQLAEKKMYTLVCVNGIVVSSVKPQLKAIVLSLRCRTCKHRLIKHAPNYSAYSSIVIPSKCQGDNLPSDSAPCPSNPYEIVADECKYINVQELKLQQSPEQVSSGEMPRNVKLSCNRVLVDKVKPGMRISVIGIHSSSQSKPRGVDGGSRIGSDYRIPFIDVVGMSLASSASDIIQGLITDDEQQQLIDLVAQTPDIYDKISRSIAPSIMGKEDVKKAIACCLFGGSPKRLPDGMALRGDINVLLLGDPSVAKSQFLKFASQVAPISVYTSGKGSSAAGLTATVVRSAATGEFHLEAGALVLADGGLVCIDEFDKMREQDRVAIHEAMEQQTISIAKAGITTILNSRSSVLAAANPVFGRYDDMKSATENIDFQTTILSRFDLIFILRDLQNDELDEMLATHLLNVHKHGESARAGTVGDANQQSLNHDTIDTDTLKKLIAFSRKIKPVLNEEAKQVLINRYVQFRRDMARKKFLEKRQMSHSREKHNASGHAQVIPITVRQLEAIVRIAESIARMHLSMEATKDHVEEALRLFKVATLQAASSPFGNDSSNPQTEDLIKRCEQSILQRVALGSSLPTRSLFTYLSESGFDEYTSKKALQLLVTRNTLSFEKQRKFIKRPLGSAR